MWSVKPWADKQNWKGNTAKRRQYRLNLFINRFGQTPLDNITTADLIELLQDIERTHRKRDDPTRHNMLLLAYTAVRNGDIRAMKWADLDLDNGKWELIPIKGQSNSGIKMVEKMTVPLSRQVIQILQKQYKFTGHLPYVFAKDTKDGYISDGATNVALKRLGYGGLHQSHGFRSSAKSLLMGELDYSD